MTATVTPVEPALDEAFRASIYRELGATEEETAELLAYAQSPYRGPSVDPRYPLLDEPFVAAWESYNIASLRRRLIQLQFPIAAGISADEAYRAATRRGIMPSIDRGPALESLTLSIHATAAGRIPIIVAEDRGEFETLVRALTRRNEPDVIPASMGACMVAGYNNWDRVAALRREWTARTGDDDNASWAREFGTLMAQRERYQDRFIILSAGRYSDVDGPWVPHSLTIRREHECAHYFTRRAFGSMRNTLVDELIADYMGIVAAAGRYRADWFLRFLGLEDYPRCRADGRIHNYRGTPPLSDGAFAIAQSVVVRAARNVERWDAGLQPGPRGPAVDAAVITTLARVGLEGMASPQAQALL